MLQCDKCWSSSANFAYKALTVVLHVHLRYLGCGPELHMDNIVGCKVFQHFLGDSCDDAMFSGQSVYECKQLKAF